MKDFKVLRINPGMSMEEIYEALDRVFEELEASYKLSAPSKSDEPPQPTFQQRGGKA